MMDMRPGEDLRSWYCHLCLADQPLRPGRTDVIRRSTFAEKTIQQSMGHMIGAHSYAKPAGYTTSGANNKKQQKKKKRRKRGRRS